MFVLIVIAIFVALVILFLILKHNRPFAEYQKGVVVCSILCLCFVIFSFSFEVFSKENNISEQIKTVDDISIYSVYENADGTINKITYINNASDVITVVDDEENDIVFNVEIKDDVKSATKVEVSEESYYSIFDLCDKVVNTIYVFS